MDKHCTAVILETLEALPMRFILFQRCKFSYGYLHCLSKLKGPKSFFRSLQIQGMGKKLIIFLLSLEFSLV